MHLFVQSLLGNTWKLKGVRPTTTVETLKLLIYRITGMHPEDQLLLWKGEMMVDFRHVGHYRLAEGCTLRLHPAIRAGQR